MRGLVPDWEDPLSFRVEGALNQMLPLGLVNVDSDLLRRFESVKSDVDDVEDKHTVHPLVIRFEPVDSLKNEVMYVMCSFKWEQTGKIETPKIVVEQTLHENDRKAW